MRNIYSPSEFLRIARPPWFESGRQQDCSEFLTYLLDTLQEEKRATMPVVTEDTQENQAVTSDVLVDQDENMNSCASDIRSEIMGLKDEVKQGQNHMAEFDAVPLGVAIEDMDVIHEEVLELIKDTDDEEEENLTTSEKRLSRGSPGKLGLSRWSTEENLSIGDSREGLNTEGSNEMLTVPNQLVNNDASAPTRACLDSHSSSSDSGIQSVGSQTPEEDDPTPPVSLVHRMFGGRMETCYTCQTCNNTSMFRDWFTDLHLAIPQAPAADSTAAPDNQKILAQKETLKRAFNEMSSSNSSQSKGTESSERKVQVAPFITKLDSAVTESSERKVQVNVFTPDSDHETVADDSAVILSENIPTVNPSITVTPPSTILTVGDLVQHYLAPELLSGGNQYQCDNCNMLRDAVKTTTLSSAPEYLNITLLRFKYDRTTNRRAKVFTTVDYPQELVLPVAGAGVPYRLYSVVIHSGYSSDGGHYYTWCSNPATSAWLCLNDSQVSQATWGQFKQQTSKLSRDTAYLLFYERVGAEEPAEDVVPHRLVMNKVIRDNMNYIREKENVGVRFQTNSGNNRRDDRGDGDGSSSGCNENFGQFGGGRCVF